MLSSWWRRFMHANFRVETTLLPLFHCSEKGERLQLTPGGTWRNAMNKLGLKIACHHQSISILLKQHPGRGFTFVGTQRQDTSTPKGQRRDGIRTTVSVTLVCMRIYTMSLIVIVPVPQSLPRLVQPDRAQLSIGKSFIILQQGGIPQFLKSASSLPHVWTSLHMFLMRIGSKKGPTRTRSTRQLRSPIIHRPLIGAQHLLRLVRSLSIVTNTYLMFLHFCHLWFNELSNHV